MSFIFFLINTVISLFYFFTLSPFYRIALKPVSEFYLFNLFTLYLFPA